MKRLKLSLTQKQVAAIETALIEWAMLEAQTQLGKQHSRYFLSVIKTINRQVNKQK